MEAGDGRPPKSRGASLSLSDPLVRDAVFLEEHPGWSQRDLAEADPELIETMALVRQRLKRERQ